MATYTIEYAKSGRASCKKCKTKIAKGELRIGTHSELDDKTFTKWNLVECFNLPRKFKSVDDFVSNHLQDDTTDQILSNEEKVVELIDKISTKLTKKQARKRKKNDSGGGDDDGIIVEEDDSFMGKIKANASAAAAAAAEQENVEPDSKKAKVSVLAATLSEMDQQYMEAYLHYKSCKNDELKDVLRWNGSTVGGNKDELLMRVIDGHCRGRLGKCSTCGVGKLKVMDDGSKVSCSGWYDEDSSRHIPCYAKFKIEEAPRFQPWHTENPGAEQIEQDEKMALDAASATTETTGQTNDDRNELEAAVGKMEWDITNGPAGLKKAATDMLEICKEKVELPDNEKAARMGIGTIIAHKQMDSPTPQDILALVIEKYGLKEEKKVAAANKTKSMAGACGNEANVHILEVILELGSLYFKENNTNAGITYKKVAEAIRGVDFVINADNAKGLGKGKSKIDGIGKGSAEKIYEFVTTGKIEKLEEKRAAAKN